MIGKLILKVLLLWLYLTVENKKYLMIFRKFARKKEEETKI
jgi:hypothetical protein